MAHLTAAEPVFISVDPDLIVVSEEAKPVVFESLEYPLQNLTDRIFEKLTYIIFSEEIRSNEYLGRFDSAELMQGTGEKGRDVRLLRNGSTVGVAQCKHSSNTNKKVDRPTAARELIKLVLHSLKSPSLLHPSDTIYWYIVTNTDLTSEASDFVNNPGEHLNKHRDHLRTWATEVLREYAAFAEIVCDEQLEAKILAHLGRVKSEKRCGTHLSLAISRYEKQIAPQFFKIKLVCEDSDVLLSKISNRVSDIVKSIKETPSRSPDRLKQILDSYAQRLNLSLGVVRTLVFGNRNIPIEMLYEPISLLDIEMREKIKISDFPAGLFKYSQCIRITNYAGMGKSTLVAWLARKAMGDGISIPVIVRLRKINKRHRIHEEVLEQVLAFNVEDGPCVLDSIMSGGYLFLLDGYDEVSADDREFVVNDIQMFISRSPENKFILTSRPDSDLANFSGMWMFEIVDLDRAQAFSLLRRLGQIAHAETVEELICELNSPSSANAVEFLTNPLLISLLYLTYIHTPKLDLRRTLFFKRIYEALFDGHDLLKDRYVRVKRSGLDIDRFEQILRMVAWLGAKKVQVEHGKDELLRIIKQAAEFSGIAIDVPRDYLHDLTQAVPLIVEEGGAYRWVHRSLQDYFSAALLRSISPDRREGALRLMYENQALSSFVEMLKLLHELDPFMLRHTMQIWLLREYECCLGSDLGQMRRRINFEFLSFGICFYSNEFLAQMDNRGTISEAVDRHLQRVPSISGMMRMGHGPEDLGNGVVMVLKFQEYTKKVSSILHGVYNELAGESLYPEKRQPRSKAAAGPGPLKVNTWYISTDQIVTESGRLEPYKQTPEEAEFIDRQLFGRLRFVVPRKVRQRIVDIETEISIQSLAARDLFEL